MKKVLVSLLVTFSFAGLGSTLAAKTSPATSCEVAGATWHRWPQAQKLAHEQGKPILLLQMFGELNEEWC